MHRNDPVTARDPATVAALVQQERMLERIRAEQTQRIAREKLMMLVTRSGCTPRRRSSPRCSPGSRRCVLSVMT